VIFRIAMLEKAFLTLLNRAENGGNRNVMSNFMGYMLIKKGDS
jgi:hypothetical protein